MTLSEMPTVAEILQWCEARGWTNGMESSGLYQKLVTPSEPLWMPVTDRYPERIEEFVLEAAALAQLPPTQVREEMIANRGRCRCGSTRDVTSEFSYATGFPGVVYTCGECRTVR